MNDSPDSTRDDESRAKKRERLLAAFGDVLPEGTKDDNPEDGERRDGSGDDWLKNQVPPHHG